MACLARSHTISPETVIWLCDHCHSGIMRYISDIHVVLELHPSLQWLGGAPYCTVCRVIMSCYRNVTYSLGGNVTVLSYGESYSKVTRTIYH